MISEHVSVLHLEISKEAEICARGSKRHTQDSLARI